jgi:hypothetical protein
LLFLMEMIPKFAISLHMLAALVVLPTS